MCLCVCLSSPRVSLSPTPLIAASNVKAPAHVRWADGPQTSTNGAQCQNVPGVLAAPFSVPPRVHLLRPPRGAGLLAGGMLISGRGLQRRASHWPVPSVRTTTTAGGHRKVGGHPPNHLDYRPGRWFLISASLVTGCGEPGSLRRPLSFFCGVLSRPSRACWVLCKVSSVGPP